MTKMAEEDARKPAYDARQRFYEVLMKHLDDASGHAEVGNTKNWYLKLHNMFTMVSPWLKSTDREKIKEELVAVRKKIIGLSSLGMQRSSLARSLSGGRALQVEAKLLDMQEELLQASRHMMLPEGGDEMYQEWDENRFLEESS